MANDRSRPAFSSLTRRDWMASGLCSAIAAMSATTGRCQDGRDGPQGKGKGTREESGLDRPDAKAQDAFEKGSQATPDDGSWRLSYAAPQTQRWSFGLKLNTAGATCNDVLATFPVPMAWPEQSVRLISTDIDPLVNRWAFRDHPGGARQFVCTMPRVPSGADPEVLIELEVIKSRIMPPVETSDLLVPQRTKSELKAFLGVSPYIDTGNSQLRSIAKELAERDLPNAWSRVESIYDWVRENVQYVEGDLKSASQAIRDGDGDCEELTSVFVALCRINKIPARMVWIPDHCYPEFYLEDEQGQGTWFPCQAAGTRQFGEMDEYRPILQKGDRFKVPEKGQQVRYIAEFFRCVPAGNRQPRPVFVREVIEV